MNFKRQRQINSQRLNGLAEPVPVPMTKGHQQINFDNWPSETAGVPMTQSSSYRGHDNTVMQPTRHAAFMKNKQRNESSNWMMQQAPPNIQQMNYGSVPVQSYVDDKIDYSAYEMGKKNFQNFVPGDANLPAGAYYDTPAYIDPATGNVMNYDLPPSNSSMQPSQQIKILEVNMAPKMKNIQQSQKSLPMQQPCNNPNCTGCRGK